MSDRVRPEPAKYKTTNWRRYNQALKARGALMIWLDRDLQWSGLASGKRGRTPLFSDAAIQFCLTIKVRIPLMADSDSIPIADSVPGDGGHVARVS